MVGGPSMVAGGITSKAYALVLAPNEPCSVLSVKVAGPWFCLKADPRNSQVQLTWSPSAPLGSVTVYYAPPQGAGRPAAVTNVTDKGALVNRLNNKIEYTFWLVGRTVESDPVPAIPVATRVHAPGTPAGLTATPGDGKATLAWSAPASAGGSPVTSYNVYVATSPDFQGASVVTGVTGTALAVIDLVNGTPYYFRMTAVNKVGEGQPSSVVPALRRMAAGPARCPIATAAAGQPDTRRNATAATRACDPQPP